MKIKPTNFVFLRQYPQKKIIQKGKEQNCNIYSSKPFNFLDSVGRAQVAMSFGSGTEKKEDHDDWVWDIIKDIKPEMRPEDIEAKKREAERKNFEQTKNEISKTLLKRNVGETTARIILSNISKTNIELAKALCEDDNFPKNLIAGVNGVLNSTTDYNIDFAKMLCADKNFPKEKIAYTLSNTTQSNRDLALAVYNCDEIPNDFLNSIIINYGESDSKEKIDEVVNWAADFSKKMIPYKEIYDIFFNMNAGNFPLVKHLSEDKDFSVQFISPTINHTHVSSQEDMDKLSSLAKYLVADSLFNKKSTKNILLYTNPYNLDIAKYVCKSPRFSKKEIGGQHGILSSANSLILRYTQDKRKEAATWILELCKNPDIPSNKIKGLLTACNFMGFTALSDKDKNLFSQFVLTLLDNKNYSEKEITEIAKSAYSFLADINENDSEKCFNIITKLCSSKSISSKNYSKILAECNSKNIDLLDSCIEEIENGEIQEELLQSVLNQDIPLEDAKKLSNAIDKKNLSKLGTYTIGRLYDFIGLFYKREISEISIKDKRQILKNLMKYHDSLFSLYSSKDFPLLPRTPKQYCEFLNSLVNSIGIQTKPLTDEAKEKYKKGMNQLSDTLKGLTDEEVNSITIGLKYSQDDFIKDIQKELKKLTDNKFESIFTKKREPHTKENEIQKIFDYFGFELQKDVSTATGYSLIGYPIDRNDKGKLSKITDERTLKAIENLRPIIRNFTIYNKILCNNPDIQSALKKLKTAFPEIIPIISKKQADDSNSNLFQQSLKVMQQILKNKKFYELNDSDKQIMLLASLFHNTNSNSENKAEESAFDTYFITKKLGLTKQEEIKLYNLVKHQDWTDRMQSLFESSNPASGLCKRKDVAYDLHQSNLFNLELLLTRAKIKSNSDAPETTEKSLIKVNVLERELEKYIYDFKKSQPLLPITKFPKASEIDKAITKVNSDGSTNIKGVYKVGGNTIIKFNEVEDFEAIGFPKGSTNKGYISDDKTRETGNIKFFAHGLDNEMQLTNFEAFALPDSDAILSVSYAEAPETKFRFFRTQGLILDVDTQYIHGGGNTDGGTGTKKDINSFKKTYIVNSSENIERNYISDLIKNSAKFLESEYVPFVEENENKQMVEITPKEIQEKLIKTFATINSNARRGDREYNEMLISNPIVMGVYAYPWNPANIVGDMRVFMLKQPNFLKDYAKDNDLPFVVFGN